MAGPKANEDFVLLPDVSIDDKVERIGDCEEGQGPEDVPELSYLWQAFSTELFRHADWACDGRTNEEERGKTEKLHIGDLKKVEPGTAKRCG